MTDQQNELRDQRKELVTGLLALILKDRRLLTPVYRDDFNDPHPANPCDPSPLVCIGSEDREAGTFSITVNAQALNTVLEKLMPRGHRWFDTVRDDIELALLLACGPAIVATCQARQALPSDLYR